MIHPFLNYVSSQQTHDKSGKPVPKDTKNSWHKGIVLSVEENLRDSKDPDIGVAIITHGGEKNPDFVPEMACKYVEGPGEESKGTKSARKYSILRHIWPLPRRFAQEAMLF